MDELQRAYASIETPHLRARAAVEVTPAGLLALGGMVATILAGSAAIVLAARRPAAPPRLSDRRGSTRSRR
ncbi:hypothetical protein KZ813_05025 [Sphingomonas sp. RHCKR7]|uniref:hypothetical protein n=1 Tax=Sphingomonas folli TaxID=2862497 RepID=UPI001CA504F8|nr:hypothetical protein [Sphingomonas folli]MBW6526193.1 hypothetical protein [Sphingomonas folli]